MTTPFARPAAASGGGSPGIVGLNGLSDAAGERATPPLPPVALRGGVCAAAAAAARLGVATADGGADGGADSGAAVVAADDGGGRSAGAKI